MRVLAIGAHPDDVEILCAGTLAHYIAQGANAVIAVFTNGELGSQRLSRVDAAQVRRLEAERAAHTLGAELYWIGQPDGFLFDTRETRMLVIDLFRRTKPDVVFAHHPADYHPDHRAVSVLANVGRLYSHLQALETHHPATTIVPPLFFMDTVMGFGVPSPDLWIDVTSTMHYKDAMLAEHMSQKNSGQGGCGADLLEMMHRQAAHRGMQINVPFAEAFFCASTYPTSTASDLVPAGKRVSIPVTAKMPSN
jgi:N-acetylglucosamine malate deacetylase 1